MSSKNKIMIIIIAFEIYKYILLQYSAILSRSDYNIEKCMIIRMNGQNQYKKTIPLQKQQKQKMFSPTFIF